MPPSRSVCRRQKRVAGGAGVRRAGRSRRSRGSEAGPGCAAACDLERRRTSTHVVPGRSWAVSSVVGSAHGWLGAVGFAASARRCRDRRLERRPTARLPAPGLVPVALPPRHRVPQSRLACVETGGGRGRGRFRGALRLPPCWRPLDGQHTVDGQHTGASFRAANWRWVGKTSGRSGGAAKTPKAVYMYGAAGAPTGSRTAFCAAGGRGRPGPEELGGTRVRRRAAGRRTPERTAGDLRPDPGGRAGVHGCREGGKAYYRLQAGQRSGNGGEHPATASALQAGGEDGVVRAGRQHAELREAWQWVGNQEPDRRRRPRPAPARHGEHGRVAAGGSASRVRRPAAGRGEEQASRGEEAPRVFATVPRPPRLSTACKWSASREADFVDLFVERRERTPGVELLVRAKTNRVLEEDDKLFDKVRKSPAQSKMTIKRLSARVKASKQAAKATSPSGHRQAALSQGEVAGEGQGSRDDPACPRGKPANRSRPAVPVDDAAGRGCSRRRAHVVRFALENRRLFPRLEVRLPRNLRTKRPSDCNAPLPWSSPGASTARLGRELPDLPPELLFSDVELRVLALFAAQQGCAEKPRGSGCLGRKPRRLFQTQAGSARRGVDVVRLRPTRRYGFFSGT